MKQLLPILFLFVFAIAPNVNAEDLVIKETETTPTTYAVLYYAQWCESCKILDPKVSEVQANLAKELQDKIEFVKFDFTDDATKEASATLAANKGLDRHFEEKTKTGRVKIIDAESGNVLAVFNKEHTVDQMQGALSAISARL